MKTEEYFKSISEETEKAYEVARKARKQSKDPEQRVDIPVATDLPEKASSLVIAAQFNELEDQGVPERIRELEDKYGKNDERVAFQIAREIAEEKFLEFDERERACDAGLRVGVSYMTGGITTAPLEGIGEVKIRENDDGSKYLAVYYSGPIRSAGGTASAMSVLIADYVRIGVGLDKFKPSETVIDRYATEVEDYYNRVTAKQYNPTREETKRIAENVPVEVTGSPTEDLDVSNYKDLDRVETNKIRGGMCLVYLDGLPLKAPKIEKRIEKWGKDFGLEHWTWIKDYLDLQKEIHSSGDDEESEEKEGSKYTPSDKYLGSLTAGRPVFGHPGEKGGFRIRYGHSRTNGLAGVSFHPATMEITQRFIAIGTQLKVEYPMKGTVGTPCDTIEPPTVRLKSGEVIRVDSREKAIELEDEIDEILFLGDMLVTYGEFIENGKRLIPSPYVSEGWDKEMDRALKEKEMELGKDFSDRDPTPEEAEKISKALDIKYHPRWTHFWTDVSPGNFKELYQMLQNKEHEQKKAKKALEQAYIPHNKDLEIEKNDLKALKILLDLENDHTDKLDMVGSSEDIPKFIEEVSGLEIGKQSTHYMGGRMGRPEKAEKRTLTGKPQMLFPCGKQEGGRMRNLSAAYNQKMHGGKQGIVKENIIHNRCTECNEVTHYSFCRECDAPADPIWFCSNCFNEYSEKPEECESCGNERFQRHKKTDINVKEMMDKALDNLGMKEPPELLKSFRGMTSKHKHVEPIEKGLLREKHDLYVNKDATVRYDALDIPITHFKPREISAPIEKLKELGYSHDIEGEPLESDDQVLALRPQDIIIPESERTQPASDYFVNVANFVDDLLEQFYGLEPYYNAESKEDLIGSLVIGLAPHTSGGTVGRIIGFTKAKGMYAHPYWHAAKRRNCLPGKTKVKTNKESYKSLKDIFESGTDRKNADQTGTIEKNIDQKVVAFEEGELTTSKAIKAYKMKAPEHKLELETDSGKRLEIFPDHRMETKEGKKKGRSLEEGDQLIVNNEGQAKYEELQEIQILQSDEAYMYDIEVQDTHNFMTKNKILSSNCDGDEDAILLLMDGLLNFSRDFLPDMTGARSVTEDTRIFTKIDGVVRGREISEVVDEVLDDEGFETRSDGFEVNREFDQEVKVASFRDSGDVEFREVSALIRHKNDKQVYEVKTTRGEIKVTEDHSVFTTKGKDIEAKPVRDLEEGEAIITPSNPDLGAEGLPEEIDLFELLEDEKCYIDVPEEEIEELNPKIKEKADQRIMEKYGEHNVYRYRTGRRAAPLKFYKEVGVVPSCKVRTKSGHQSIDRKIENRPELYRLLGYLISEGALKRGDVYNTDKELISDVRNCIESLTSVTPKLKKDEREGKKLCYFVRVPETFMQALEKLGLEREKFDDKRVPSFVFGASEQYIEEFIKAYRAGDGSIYEEKGFSKLYTKSGEMAFQLAMLLRKIGFKTSAHLAGETWEVLYSEWQDKDPYWPLWDLTDEVRNALYTEGETSEEVQNYLSNYRKNNRMKTASRQKVVDLYDKGLMELRPAVEGDVAVERVKEINEIEYGDKYVYDLEVPETQNFLCGPHPIFAHNTMDAALILSTVLNPDEIDDEAWAIETVSEYPLEFYYETQEYKKPWNLDCEIEIGEDIVHSDEAFTHGFTHETVDIDDGPDQSEYVTLDEMSEKTSAQLGIGEKIAAVDEDNVAELLLQKHFLPDIRGNLRAFSKQKMRCVDCNEKFRRVPMTNQAIAPTGKTTSKCPECGGKVLLTITDGTIKKYMQPSKDIIEEYEVTPYLRQQVLMINRSLQSLFGKDQRQSGLKQFT